MDSQILQREAEALCLPCFDLVPAQPGEPLVAHWGGRRLDLNRPSHEHILSVDQDLFPMLPLAVPWPLVLCRVQTPDHEVVPRIVHVSEGKIDKVRFEDSIPLTYRPATSLPPLEALILYGGQAIQAWLASRNLTRANYGDVYPDMEDLYRSIFDPHHPLFFEEPPIARLGGWHLMWPADDFYIPREMRLAAWTFQDSEPWYEVFLTPRNGHSVYSRIT